MISFVKELDETTLRLVRHINQQQWALAPRMRNLRFVVVWVDGDKEQLAAWAAENGVAEVPLCVICSNDKTLESWRLNPMAMSTIVFMDHLKPVSKIIDLRPDEFPQIGERITKHFRRYFR